MKTRFPLIITLATAALLWQPMAHADGRVLGAVIGSGAGAVIGQAMGGRDGAIVGTAAGAAAGYLLAGNDYAPYYSTYGTTVQRSYAVMPPRVRYVPIYYTPRYLERRESFSHRHDHWREYRRHVDRHDNWGDDRYDRDWSQRR